jgi:hypothetical protein
MPELIIIKQVRELGIMIPENKAKVREQRRLKRLKDISLVTET